MRNHQVWTLEYSRVTSVVERFAAVIVDVTRSGNQWTTSTFAEVSKAGVALPMPMITICNANLLKQSLVSRLYVAADEDGR